MKSIKHPCVFYKTHNTRKHGVKFDRQWIIRQTLGKKTRVSVLGWESEGIKLADAMRAADEFRSNFKKNIANPHLPPLPICIEDSQQKARKNESEYPLFVDFAERFIKNHVKKKLTESTAREYERQIRKYFIPAWGNIKVLHIQRKQIVRLIEEISDTAPIQANRTLATIKKMFNYAVDVGVVDINPASRIKTPAKERPRQRVLNLKEITILFKVLETLPDRDTQDILKLITLTAQRPGEVAEMRVSQIKREADDGIWLELSTDDTKNNEPQRIFLHDMATQIIQDRINDLRYDNYIFPANSKKGFMRKDVLVGKVQRIQVLMQKKGVEYFTAHDLRRSAATGIARLGYGGIVDDILNHKRKGITRRVYDLYDRAPEIRQALSAWGQTVQHSINGNQAKIIEIKKYG
ncbi:MAG: tyrosine-type recombinase/integrase [Thermodesulfobacteriota bacterium]|nr:tyrosine-type recombinase/integrase [Thermodesulfobacteriota bacterium]